MGVMLVVGFAALIVAIASKISHRHAETAAARPAPAAPIEIPRGAKLEGMTSGSDRLILDFVMPQGERQILVLDLATGARINLIKLDPAPAVAPAGAEAAKTGAP